MIGLVILLLLGAMAVLAPIIAPYNPTKISLREGLVGPSATHLMGTDRHGRDVFSRVVFGARISLQLGLVANAVALGFGLVFGLLSGYYGGWMDSTVMRLMDVLLALPSILLAMVAIAILGPGLSNAMLAIGIAQIPAYARLVRGSTLSAKNDVYVDAARCIGCSSLRIMFRHILPNILAPVVVFFTLGVGTAILFGSALSFIGLGAQPPTPEWGRMLADGRDLMRRAWWVTVFPGLAIMITVLAVNLFGDGLRSYIDPRLKVPGAF
jgi:peptide/nickel transport system permease protein